MNLNKFSQAKSEFSHVVQMVRNHIAKEHFIGKVILSVSNSNERLGEGMPKYVQILCQMPNMEMHFIPMLQSSTCISQTILYHTQIVELLPL